MRFGVVPNRILRRAIVFGGPLLVYAAILLHPTDLAVGGDNDLFVAVHLAFPFLICLLTWALVLLVDGIDDPAATAVRVLAIPFAVAYTAFATFDGIAIGMFVRQATALPDDAQPAAARLIHDVANSELEWPLYLVAAGTWLAIVLALVLALRRQAPLPALLLLAVGGLLFAKSHVRPWGPAGMTAFLAGAVWVELHAAGAADRARGVGLAARRRI